MQSWPLNVEFKYGVHWKVIYIAENISEKRYIYRIIS
jgi:hypothetical protein